MGAIIPEDLSYFSYETQLEIPSIAIGAKNLMGYLEVCGYLTPVFDGRTNLGYDFGCFLMFEHVVIACSEQGVDIRLLRVLVDKQALIQFDSRIYVVCR